MIITAKIRSLCSDGRFAGKVVKAEDSTLIGMTVFAANVVPEELVELEVTQQEKKYLSGKLLNIVEKSPLRIEPPCIYFGLCGGCNLQHLDLAEQHRLKKELFVQTYQKISGHNYSGELRAFLEPQVPYHYRKRINLHFKNGELGYYQVDSHQLIAIDACLLAQKPINKTLAKLKTISKSFPNSLSEVSLEILDSGDPLVLFKIDPQTPNFPQDALKSLIALKKDFSRIQVTQGKRTLFSNIRQENSLGHFSQVNQQGNRYLRDLIIRNLKGQSITELYAGGGNFTFPVHRLGKKIVAVESDLNLVQFAQDQIKKDQLKDLHFVHSTSENFVKRNLIRETLLLDPPRAGAKEVLKMADFSKTKEVIYISCNPATFIRDTQILESLGFKIEFIQLVDMFPQTAHQELFARFIK